MSTGDTGLSTIEDPINPVIFSTKSLFGNIDHLFGVFFSKWKIINLHGYYGISGREEITKFSVT